MQIKIHPLTGKPIEPIWTAPNGRVFWPILGGDDTVPPAQPPAQPATPPATPPTPAPPAPAPSDKGFPEGTPLEQMTAEQQTAYWKHYARQHEQRVKDLGSLTPEQLSELRDKAEKHDKLERELMSDKDKAIAEAKDAAETEARNAFLPQLVLAEFKAAAAGRIPAEQLEGIVGPLDKAFFYSADGKSVDADKVKTYVDQLAPAATPTPPGRRGPSPAGTGGSSSGRPAGGGSGATGVDAGREAYARRHGKKSA